MKTFLTIMTLLSSFTVAAAQQTSIPSTGLNATEMKEIDSEAKAFTGVPCTGNASEYFKEQNDATTTKLILGETSDNALLRHFDAMLKDSAKGGLELRKSSTIKGGKQAYLYDNATQQGTFIVMQLVGKSLNTYSCLTK